jgi:hypothetical protein
MVPLEAVPGEGSPAERNQKKRTKELNFCVNCKNPPNLMTDADT